MTSVTVYATVDELKAQPGVTGAQDDTVFLTLLTAASRTVDGFCNRAQDGFVALATAEARQYAGSGLVHQWIDECVVVESVAVKYATTDTVYTLLPMTDWIPFSGGAEHPDYNRKPYTGLMANRPGTIGLWPDGITGTYDWEWPTVRRAALNSDYPKLPMVEVTAKWGYAATVPSGVKQATITQAARWAKRGQSFWADSAASTDFGVMQYRRELDPDVKMMLQLGRLVRPTYSVMVP